MKFVFLMDPLETVDVYKDTSFIFMVGAHRRGHEIYYLPSGGISLLGPDVILDVIPIVPRIDERNPFERGRKCRLVGEQVGAVFVRSDPPFDQEYLNNTWLLDRLPGHVPVINSPRGLRTVNEKLWATQFSDLVPPTLVTRDLDLFEGYLSERGQIVVKPTDGHGGVGVFFVKAGDTNARVMFEMLSDHGRKEVIVQEFVEQAQSGDKRIVLLDGEALGAVMRVHSDRDHRNNFFAGGKAQPAEINDRDRHIVDTLRPHLKELGLVFTGIDVIGDFLIEVNVTSPTCVQEINRLNNVTLEDRVIEHVENMINERRGNTSKKVVA